jgi:hypothetical protein
LYIQENDGLTSFEDQFYNIVYWHRNYLEGGKVGKLILIRHLEPLVILLVPALGVIAFMITTQKDKSIKPKM